MENPGPAAMQPTEETKIDPENAKLMFALLVKLSDDQLRTMNEKDFRSWMDTMINGIVCIAEDRRSQEWEKWQRTHTRDQFFIGRSTYDKRGDNILQWRKDWRDDDIQRRIGQLTKDSRGARKNNFLYLSEALETRTRLQLVRGVAHAWAGGPWKEGKSDNHV